MDGIRGYRGWRWVFILGMFKQWLLKGQNKTNDSTEGLLTCVVAFVFYFVISDFPEEAKWLTAEERQFVKARLQEDVGGSQRHKPLTVKGVFSILKECQLYRSDFMNKPNAVSSGNIILGGFMYFGLIVPAYGYGESGSLTRMVEILRKFQHTSRPLLFNR